MCYDDGTLQEYIDREITGRKRWEIEAHIASCEECKRKLAALEKANNYLASGLSTMSSKINVGEKDLEQAWVRLAKDERFGAPVKKTEKKGALEMTQDRLRKVLLPAAAVAMVAIAFSLAPVRSFAADLLNIFRVEKLEVITFSPEDMHQMERQMKKIDGENGGAADIKNFGKIESTGFKQTADMAIADAQKAAGFELKLPSGAEGYTQSPKAHVSPGSEVSLTLDVEKANKVIESFGGEVLLPDELDGKKFTIKVPTAVAVDYKKGDSLIGIAQVRSPEMILPDGVNPLTVRAVLLRLPMIPENVRKQLEAIQDWKHTMIIPNIEGSSREVDVNGSQGVFISPPAKDDGINALAWQKDGVIYMINGNVDLARAQEIAASMK